MAVGTARKMTTEQLQIVELVKGALGQEMNDALLSHIDLEKLLDIAQGQAVAGIVMEGLEKLSPTKDFDKTIIRQWIAVWMNIQQINSLHVKALKSIYGLLSSKNIPVAFMKGLTVAQRYPQPLSRTAGDIDFIVAKDDFKRTLKALEEIAVVDYDLVHEHHGMAHIGGITVEPHYKVHNYQYKSNDRAMQEIFNENFPSSLRTISIDGEQIPIFPPTMESVFLVSHMVNHVYEEGLGLRQVIDYRQMLEKDGCKINWTLHAKYLQRMHMTRAFHIFTRICEKYLGLPTDICNLHYSSNELRFADKMLDDIMKVGNFGRNAYVFDHSSKLGETRNYLWVLGRCIRLGYLCRTESMSWPISKVKRYFWKKSIKKNYDDN